LKKQENIMMNMKSIQLYLILISGKFAPAVSTRTPGRAIHARIPWYLVVIKAIISESSGDGDSFD